MPADTLDCKGLNCPMPIVKISQAMRQMSAGEQLVVEATDPAFKADLEAWAQRFGHTIASFENGACARAVLIKS